MTFPVYLDSVVAFSDSGVSLCPGLNVNACRILWTIRHELFCWLFWLVILKQILDQLDFGVWVLVK